MWKSLIGKRIRIIKIVEYHDSDEKKRSHDIIGIFEESGICKKVPTLLSTCIGTIFNNDSLLCEKDKKKPQKEVKSKEHTFDIAMKALPKNGLDNFKNACVVIHFYYEDVKKCKCKLTFEGYKYKDQPYYVYTPKNVMIVNVESLLWTKGIKSFNYKTFKPIFYYFKDFYPEYMIYLPHFETSEDNHYMDWWKWG